MELWPNLFFSYYVNWLPDCNINPFHFPSEPPFKCSCFMNS